MIPGQPMTHKSSPASPTPHQSIGPTSLKNLGQDKGSLGYDLGVVGEQDKQEGHQVTHRRKTHLPGQSPKLLSKTSCSGKGVWVDTGLRLVPALWVSSSR